MGFRVPNTVFFSCHETKGENKEYSEVTVGVVSTIAAGKESAPKGQKYITAVEF